MPTSELLGGTIAVAAVALAITAGLVLLRSASVQRKRAPLRIVAGWSVIVAGIACAAFAWSEMGLVTSLAAGSVLAYVVVAMVAERREKRTVTEREAATEPEERATSWRRAIAKSLLAIVLAGIAAVGIGIAFAVAAPLAPVDRIVIGGLLVPMLWGAGMAWTLCDAKLLRATVLLLAISAGAYAIAFLPKMLSS